MDVCYIEDFRGDLSLKVMLLRGDKNHSLIDLYFRLMGIGNHINTFTIHTNRSKGNLFIQVFEPSQDIIQTFRLAGILFKTNNGKAFILD